MFDYLKLYIATLTLLLALDFVWISIVAKGFYAKYLGYLMAPQINLLPAIIFYIFKY